MRVPSAGNATELYSELCTSQPNLVNQDRQQAMTMQRIFLCHSSVDKAFVRRLREDLVASGLSVWVDEKEILVGDNIREKIEAGLRASDFLAIVLTPESVSSPWVQRELDAKIIQEIEDRKVIVLPLLLRDCEIPPFLRMKHYADFRHGYENGLAAIKARFTQQDHEQETKRTVLQGLLNGPLHRINLHGVIQLAVDAGAIDPATALLDAHAAAAPNCGCLPALRMMIAGESLRFERTPANVLRALEAADQLVRRSPSLRHAANIESVAALAVRDASLIAPVLALLRGCRGPSGWAQSNCAAVCAAGYLTILERLPLTNEQIGEVCEIACDLSSTVRDDILPRCLSNILRAGTHLARASATENEIASRMSCIYQNATARVLDALEFSQAYIHLAWAALHFKDEVAANHWLGRYRLTVQIPEYERTLVGHPPLDKFLSSEAKQRRAAACRPLRAAVLREPHSP